MLTAIRHTAVLVLGLMLVAVVACGGGSQTADTPTPETKVVAKAMVEATAQAFPTATPVPQTVRTTPTATVSNTSKSSISAIDTSGANWNHLSAAENYRRISPPDAKAIKLEYDEIVGKVRVIASPGAVPAGTNVMVANLELGGVTLVRADSAGAFETSVAASPGTHILIKQDPTGQQIRLNNVVDEQLINLSLIHI